MSQVQKSSLVGFPDPREAEDHGNVVLVPSEPKTDIVAPGLDEIPYEGIEAIGAIFKEGEGKYGRDNWKKGVGSIGYQRERTRHAIRHLQLWANGDRSEPHLAKVAWFCVTQIWINKHEEK